jgi:hypothetical protein
VGVPVVPVDPVDPVVVTITPVVNVPVGLHNAIPMIV